MSAQTSQYRKQYLLDRSRGIARAVPAGPVREHLDVLRERGLSYDAIADASQIAKATIHRIAKGGTATVRAGVADQLLAVQPAQVLARPNPAAFVPNLGARRRIRALLAAGWRHVDITAAAGYSDESTTPRSAVTLHQQGDWITRETHDAIVRAYQALSGGLGPGDLTRKRALAAGYPPPAAWDDELLDDPTALPAPGWRPGECKTPGCTAEPAPKHAACKRCYGRRRDKRRPDAPKPRVDLDEFMWLIDAGEDPQRATRRLGVSIGAVNQAAVRAGRKDVTRITRSISKSQRASAPSTLEGAA
ncbi:helix-turn-helix domain-containing protein [Oerskovia enterophila]|uniref:Uncharacterized protein n=1 Tax=Oerskovia enterophila TaxID=43678 RepID=A0A163QTS1_9CELL|nr:helix-turn-helix transcriptional regulator [Oerskovia enterophila]KZM34521.1 hypothetical protein OJAG_28200 [Oerskovia enterophila]